MDRRVALIKDGKVHDVQIVGDTFQPPKGSKMIVSEDGNIGDLFDGRVFTKLEDRSKSKDELVVYAIGSRMFNLNRMARVKFDDAEFPLNDATRNDIRDLASLGTDETIVIEGRAYPLTAAQLGELHGIMAKQIARSYRVLASYLKGIESGRIKSYKDIDEGESFFG